MDNSYKYFFSIVEQKNITKAAKMNYITQSSMTHYLNRLEKKIGTKLFSRDNNAMTLTDAGKLYYRYLQDSLALYDAFQSNLAQLTGQTYGKIHLGIPLQMQSWLYPSIIAPFLKENPHIEISFNDDSSPNIERDLSYNRLDAAIIYTSKPQYPTLQYVPLAQDTLYGIASREHPLVKDNSATFEEPLALTLAEVADETFFLLAEDFIARQLANAFFARHHFKPQKITTISSMNTISNLVATGEGLSFMPHYACKAYPSPNQLAILEFNQEPVTLDITFVYKKSQHLTPAMTALSDFILKNKESLGRTINGTVPHKKKQKR